MFRGLRCKIPAMMPDAMGWVRAQVQGEGAVIPTNALHSAAYNALVRSRTGLERTALGRQAWRRLWRALIDGRSSPVATVIHGHKVIVNSGYTYPMSSRMFRSFNQPLVELVHQAARVLERPVHLVDVGAAVGDTVLLVAANCPGDVARYYCIDGDPQFFRYLTHNLGGRPDCTFFNALLSSDDAMIRSLVRTHQGTASAQGSEAVRPSTLDTLLAAEIAAGHVDVVKIDVDGFDGRALAGSRRAIGVASAVIFEWHPILCRQTGNSWLEAFAVLGGTGYTDFVWFNKFGEFCQFTAVPTEDVLNEMAGYCLADVDDDWHWDVVALKSGTRLDRIELGRMRFARERTSRW